MPSQKLSLNDWRDRLEKTYFISQNIEKDSFKVFGHLVEVVGGLSKYTLKLKDHDRSEAFVGKVLAWYLGLVTKLEFKDIQKLIWDKFPGHCPYCRLRRCMCSKLSTKPALDAEALRNLSTTGFRDMPEDLNGWQIMFDRIYGHSRAIDAISSPSKKREEAQRRVQKYFAHLVEELAETSEAIRLGYFYPENIRNELPDIFAWTMAITSVLNASHGRKTPLFIGDIMYRDYYAGCPSCKKSICICRPQPVRDAISSAGIYESPLDGPRKS